MLHRVFYLSRSNYAATIGSFKTLYLSLSRISRISDQTKGTKLADNLPE